MSKGPNYIQIADEGHGHAQIARRRNDGSYELIPQCEYIKLLNEMKAGPYPWRGWCEEGRIVQHRYLVWDDASRTIADVKWVGNGWEDPLGRTLLNNLSWMERPKSPGGGGA